MIKIGTLVKQIENGLNANAQGITYKIFSDMGTFEKALKTRKESILYTNGVMQILSSNIIPTQTLYIATISAALTLCVQLDYPQDDKQIIDVNRAVLDEFFKSSTVQILEDETGKKFTVSVNYSLASSGSAEFREIVGTSFTFDVVINYSFIENGLNSFNCSFALDGVQLPYTTANITRIPVMESNPYTGIGNSSAKNIPTSSALSFDLRIPATSGNTASSAIMQFLIDGILTEIHTLTVELSGIKKDYTVVLGQTDIALDGIDNAGHSISFVEAANLVEEVQNG